MRRFLPIVLTSWLLSVLAQPSSADCYYVSLQKFKVKESADVLSWGNFAPFIALEVGHLYPLAPEGKLEAPHDTEMTGRRYYVPRHMIDSTGAFSLWLTMIDYDEDTPDDIVLPLTKKSIILNNDSFISGPRSFTLEYTPFGDLHPPHSNSQQFTFKIERQQKGCNYDSEQGRVEDSLFRRENELKRLRAHVLGYENYPGDSQEYHSYRVKEVEERRLESALPRALDMASINARELITLGDALRELSDIPGYERVWSEYAELIRVLWAQEIPLRYRDEKGNKQQSMVPSLAFHPAWKKLMPNRVLPVLPTEWVVHLPVE